MNLLARSFLIAFLIPFAASAASLETHKIDPEKELLITDTAVVDSPLASYPFPPSGHLIVKMAGENDPSEFLKRWLVSWEEETTVNSHPLPARTRIRELLIDPWKTKDGYAGIPDDEWVVDFENAPFRLLAILNRADLSAVPPPTNGSGPISPPTTPVYYGGPTPDSVAGEGRFVFAALDPKGIPLPGDFTIIFEYRLKGASSDPSDIFVLARDWHALGTFEEFDGDYLNHLATLTNRFTSGGFPSALADEPRFGLGATPFSTSSSRGTFPPIRQIRTSEASFDDVREFREFGLASDGFLEPKSLVATPAARFEKLRVRTEDNDALAALINKNRDTIKDGSFVLPVSLTLKSGDTAPFFAARALIPAGGGSSFHWDARNVHDNEARRLISLNTCNGCHAAETGTDSCLHIHPRLAGEPAKLSKFLQIGETSTINDPATRGRRVKLAEMNRRVEFFKALLNPDMKFHELRALRRETGSH